MPICNKPPLPLGGTKSAAEVDDHNSEAAKVKRTREQAYFNSYDFDAIEVLPYDDDEDDSPTLSQKGAKSPPRHSQRVASGSSSDPSSATGSVRSSSDSFPHPVAQRRDHLKYAYLQRLGSFLSNAVGAAKPPNPTSLHRLPSEPTTASSISSSSGSGSEPLPPHNVIDVAAGLRGPAEAAMAESGGGNFLLLPRAILKYQSVGALSNSMPLAAVSVAHAAAPGKIAAPNASSTIGNTTTAALMMTTATLRPSGNSANTNNNNNSSNSSSSGSNSKTRLSHPNGNDGNSGFLMEAENAGPTATAAAAAVARSKKQSTSSTITTTTTATTTGSDGSGDHDRPRDRDIGQGDIRSSGKKSGPVAAESEKRGRTRSHQSHYSTDKSGSSGYYSSNVCSTYSLEDHIYCEPVVDILDVNSQSKSVIGEKPQKVPPPVLDGKTVEQMKATAFSRTRDMNGVGQSKRFSVQDRLEEADDDEDGKRVLQVVLRRKRSQGEAPQFNENLRVLETSIENLDRHLKSFPSLSSQERIASFVQSHHSYVLPGDAGEKTRAYTHLPTIMEGYDPASQPRSWQDAIADDSLLDIDLDSFLLASERKGSKGSKSDKPSTVTDSGIDNPTFLTDEQEENHYKCAKYINSCPEDAYRVESDISAVNGTVSEQSTSVAHFLKRYEDQLHFQDTRELLEDVREKIRLLSHSGSEMRSTIDGIRMKAVGQSDEVPKELEGMIQTLKSELETYLSRMNQHSELEIRQLCSGLTKNQNIVKMQKAFERRRHSVASSTAFDPDYGFSAYDAVRDGVGPATSGVPLSIREKIASIRCASDPNFKMKRKSLAEVFPVPDCYVRSVNEQRRSLPNANDPQATSPQTQMQRNLSYHKPVLDQLNSKVGQGGLVAEGLGQADSGDSGDKDSILDWHRQKPSSWEMYYGTNRMNQSLLGKRNGMVVNSNQNTMSYPSSRPESDFTLDLPRAEQLRIKMEKEKKFRQRCRYMTTFLSLIFFLLTVMVVSLVLTRGKRMFGSMI